MSVNVAMKFTLDTSRNKTQTISQIRASMHKSIAPTQLQSASSFRMKNLGRAPTLDFNKPHPISRGCGCCGG